MKHSPQLHRIFLSPIFMATHKDLNAQQLFSIISF